VRPEDKEVEKSMPEAEDETLPFTHSPAPSLSVLVPPESEGERLDLFLVGQGMENSRSSIQRAILAGEIKVNEKIVKPSYRLNAGEAVTGAIPESPPIEAVPENIPLDILHEDAQIIVINKPAGMVTHPGSGVTSGTLANALVYHLTRTAQGLPKRGGVSRPGIVHRLDAGTSGLLVAAKTDRAHLSLAEQFESRSVRKFYTALVYGTMKEAAGEIDAPIGRDPRSRVKMAVTRDGRPALTLYRVREQFAEFALLDLEIKTGRTHQIRVHLAHIKHPVVADAAYDLGRANMIKNPKHRAAVAKLDRPFLHAARLQLAHPETGEAMEFRAPMPAELEGFLEILRG
jgi:23S rRNA pseudouridine1911/1915/1917 synthase